MPNLSGVVQQLQEGKRPRAGGNAATKRGVGGLGKSRNRGRSLRNPSAQENGGRCRGWAERIAAAQRARWAKWKATRRNK